MGLHFPICGCLATWKEEAGGRVGEWRRFLVLAETGDWLGIQWTAYNTIKRRHVSYTQCTLTQTEKD